MELRDFTPELFFKKVTYAADPSPGNKIVISNEAFCECAVWFLILQQIKQINSKI